MKNINFSAKFTLTPLGVTSVNLRGREHTLPRNFLLGVWTGIDLCVLSILIIFIANTQISSIQARKPHLNDPTCSSIRQVRYTVASKAWTAIGYPRDLIGHDYADSNTLSFLVPTFWMSSFTKSSSLALPVLLTTTSPAPFCPHRSHPDVSHDCSVDCLTYCPNMSTFNVRLMS